MQTLAQPLATLAANARPAPEAVAYTVSVRGLCEFTAKRGDLDRRFTPSATAIEGQQAQIDLASRRGPQYQTEVALQTHVELLRVRGRADGYDPVRRCLEEVKTIRGHPDDVAPNRRHLHWAQLETYGALFCRARGVKELTLALVYIDLNTQAEIELRQQCSAHELEAAFVARCGGFLAWARQEAAHRTQRDAALRELAFPQATFRPGQRDLAEAVYRAASSARTLLAQAPTGIGKTLGTLFPLLRAMPAQHIDKIAYLTCKGTGRITALQALQRLRSATPGQALRVIALVAKEQACEHPDKACHGDSCPLARGFYDRLPQARAEAVAEGWLDPEALRRVATQHQVCPYYLGQELLRWADVLVGDVHHVFDANGQLWGLAQSQDWRLAMLIDEAHNLLERVRRMHSADLSLRDLRSALALAPAPLRAGLGALLHAAQELASQQPQDYAVLEEIPQALLQSLQALNVALGEHFRRQPLALGPLLNLHFELMRFQRLAESFGEHSLFEVNGTALPGEPAASAVPPPFADSPAASTPASPETVATMLQHSEPMRFAAEQLPPAWAPEFAPLRQAECDDDGNHDDSVLSLRNIVPARFTRPRFKGVHTTTLFSATLGPAAYQRDLLGLPEDTAWLDVPPAFAPENLRVRVAQRLSTRFAHRTRSLEALTEVVAEQFDAHPGNYLAFFSSFEYLERAAQRLATRRPDIAQWRQARTMDPAARAAFLQQFCTEGRGVAFAVLGGVFAEGVDLPGRRLIGAFIATLGLPPVSPRQAQIRARLDKLFGEGHGYADLVPAMQKVVQAAGRVLRTPEDRGWLWLMDDRYLSPQVVQLLPAWWRIGAD